MKLSSLGLPFASACLFAFGVYHVVESSPVLAKPEPVGSTPARSTSANRPTIAALGTIEPSSQEIAISSHRTGVVAQVLVASGTRVRSGQPLFCLDERAQRADLAIREAELHSALAVLARLERSPRREEVSPRAARLREAEAALLEAADRSARVEELVRAGAAAEADRVSASQHEAAARERMLGALADLTLVRAGAWEADRHIARADVKRAEALVARARTELDLACVVAPIDSTVLRSDVRAGEAAVSGGAAMILGQIDGLHVRVEVDEVDLGRFRPDARATAQLRGGDGARLPLRFVRTEPRLSAKRALIGAGGERVDTRVLEVLYAVDGPSGATSLVGAQADIFIDALR